MVAILHMSDSENLHQKQYELWAMGANGDSGVLV